MGPRLKSLFLFRQPQREQQQQQPQSLHEVRGRSYDSSIAADPPVRGSYPIAGNGPDILKDIQRARASKFGNSREHGRTSTISSPPPYDFERSQTLPYHGRAPRDRSASAVSEGGRQSRSRSLIQETPRLPTLKRRSSYDPPSMTSRSATTKAREVQVYRPKGAADCVAHPTNALSHRRSESNISRGGHVDILDAHSAIYRSPLILRHRSQASGVRDYGEDVADRNISLYGEKGKTGAALQSPWRESQRVGMDLPELNYLRARYESKKRALPTHHTDPPSSPIRGHQSRDSSGSDDIVRATEHRHDRKVPTRISSPRTPPPPPPPFPLRTFHQHASSDTQTLSPATPHSRMHDDDADPPITSTAKTGKVNNLSRLPPITTSSNISNISIIQRSASPSSRTRSRSLKEPPPVAPPSEFPRVTTTIQARSIPIAVAEQNRYRRRTMSATQGSATIGDGKHHISNRPSTTGNTQQASPARSSPSKTKPSNGMIVQDAKEPPSLAGIVDLSDTVDTDVTEKTLPAVTHETMIRDRREIKQEAITREVHHHDIYHRVLPVIDTEILPAKHYQKQKDGTLTEIPEALLEHHKPTWKIESLVPSPSTHTQRQSHPTSQAYVSDSSDSPAEPPVVGMNRSIHRKPVPQSSHSHPSSATVSPNTTSYGEDGADSPIIPMVRGDPNQNQTRARSSSIKAFARKSMEPILKNKKTYVTEEGIPRTEYVWHHPAVFEDMHHRTSPQAAFYSSDMSDIPTPMSAKALEAPENVVDDESDSSGLGDAKDEESLLFRDSGYGSGSLPGLKEKSPMSGFSSNQGHAITAPRLHGYNERATTQDVSTYAGNAHGHNTNVQGGAGDSHVHATSPRSMVTQEHGHERNKSEGVATKLLKKLRERRQSNAARDHDPNASVNDLREGVQGMNMRG